MIVRLRRWKQGWSSSNQRLQVNTKKSEAWDGSVCSCMQRIVKHGMVASAGSACRWRQRLVKHDKVTRVVYYYIFQVLKALSNEADDSAPLRKGATYIPLQTASHARRRDCLLARWTSFKRQNSFNIATIVSVITLWQYCTCAWNVNIQHI